jgi:hypothetical protein
MSKPLIIVEKTCKHCNDPFKVKKGESNKRIFCSIKCSSNSKTILIEKKCKECNNIFSLKKWESFGRLFCSRECSAKSVTLRKTKLCKLCNKEFSVLNYMFNRTIYCSRECFNKNPSRKKRKASDDSKVEKTCITCNKKYIVWRYRSKSNFCSKLCKHNHGRFFGKCINCGCDFFEEKNIANNYLNRKYHCPNCVKFVPSSNNSGFQLDVFSYINSIFDKNRICYNTHIKVNGKKIWPDILIDDKIILECQGDYFHCNPIKYSPDYYHVKRQKTAKEIWDIDANRKKFLIDSGYNIIYIWENDWMNRRKETEELINKEIYEIQKNKKN